MFDRAQQVGFLALLGEVVTVSLAVRGTAFPKTSEKMPVGGFRPILGNSPARAPAGRPSPSIYGIHMRRMGRNSRIMLQRIGQNSLENRHDALHCARKPMKILKMAFGVQECTIRDDIMRIALRTQNGTCFSQDPGGLVFRVLYGSSLAGRISGVVGRIWRRSRHRGAVGVSALNVRRTLTGVTFSTNCC